MEQPQNKKKIDDTDKEKMGLAQTVDMSKKGSVLPNKPFKLLGRTNNKDKVSFFGGSNYYVQLGESFKNWLFRKHEI